MNIVPISGMAMLQNSPIANGAPQQTNSLPFQQLFTQALGNLEETSQVREQDSYNLAISEIDDLGAVFINSEKAEIALQALVQVRNQLLDAYSEIMRINM